MIVTCEVWSLYTWTNLDRIRTYIRTPIKVPVLPIKLPNNTASIFLAGLGANGANRTLFFRI
jgi:hypothetical protein